MASEDTLLGKELRLQIGDGASPQLFTDACAVSDVSGLGEQKALVEVTSLCDTSKTYRGGTPEGAEVTITSNFIKGDASLEFLYDAYQNDEVVDFRLIIGVGDSPSTYMAFSGTLLGWELPTSDRDEKVSMQFTVKITGSVVWVR